VLITSTGGTGNMKCTFIGPTGASGNFGAWPDHPVGGSVTAAARGVTLATALDLTVATSSPPAMYLLQGFISVSTTAGDLKLQAAQNTANGNALVIQQGSFLEVYRLA
jgi:hypothetical protein